MTARFHAGQEVEVHQAPGSTFPGGPRKAKIVAQYAARTAKATASNPRWQVQFADDTCAVFDEAHIRAIKPFDAASQEAWDLE